MIDFIRKTLIYFVNPKKKTSWFLKKILLINSWFFVKNYWFLNFGFGNPAHDSYDYEDFSLFKRNISKFVNRTFVSIWRLMSSNPLFGMANCILQIKYETFFESLVRFTNFFYLINDTLTFVRETFNINLLMYDVVYVGISLRWLCYFFQTRCSTRATFHLKQKFS